MLCGERGGARGARETEGVTSALIRPACVPDICGVRCGKRGGALGARGTGAGALFRPGDVLDVCGVLCGKRGGAIVVVEVEVGNVAVVWVVCVRGCGRRRGDKGGAGGCACGGSGLGESIHDVLGVCGVEQQ